MNVKQLVIIAKAYTERAQTDAPNYKAHSNPRMNCGLCQHFVRSVECDLYSFAADADYVCDSFAEREPDVGQLKGLVEKMGARNSRIDLADIQKTHDLTCRLGAKCNCDNE